MSSDKCCAASDQRCWNCSNPQANGVGSAYTCRSTIFFLISAIDFAGLSPFGQALVQFMMVWQRYSRNGSSRLSSRSPVASSRLSMIQRLACNSAAGPR